MSARISIPTPGHGRLAALVLGMLLIPTSSALAASSAEMLNEGKKLCAELAYEDCVARLNAALAAGGLSDAQNIDAYRNLGAAYLVLGNKAAAEAAFVGLLRVDASYVMSPATTNPAHLEFFNGVKKKFLAERASAAGMRIIHTPPAKVAPGDAVSLSFRIEGGAGVAGAAVHHRAAPGKPYSRVGAIAGAAAGEYSATIPGTFVTEPSMEYYIAASDRDGKDLATFASSADPYSLPVGVAATKKKSVLTRWWFWTIGGVVIASAAVGLAIALTPTQYTVVVDILPPK